VVAAAKTSPESVGSSSLSALWLGSR
jgi:hypothetical protein